MKNIEPLNDLFNIDPQASNLPADIKTPDTSIDKLNAYDLARQTLRKLIVKGEGTLDDIINLAKNSEHPRSFEVAGQIIKTMADTAKDLMNLHKQVKEIEEPTAKHSSINTQNNVVFAGSTADLMKLLHNKDEGKTIEQ